MGQLNLCALRSFRDGERWKGENKSKWSNARVKAEIGFGCYCTPTTFITNTIFPRYICNSGLVHMKSNKPT